MSLKLFEIEDGERHWVAAETILSALNWYVNYFDGDADSIELIEVVPGGKALNVVVENDFDGSKPRKPTLGVDGRWAIVATVDEWLATAEDGDMICSTAW